LYEAAKIIQKAYRSYKGRKKAEEQDKERAAAILIQNYYRRYKQVLAKIKTPFFRAKLLSPHPNEAKIDHHIEVSSLTQ
jgi:IQ calmodulin-binding motif